MRAGSKHQAYTPQCSPLRRSTKAAVERATTSSRAIAAPSAAGPAASRRGPARTKRPPSAEKVVAYSCREGGGSVCCARWLKAWACRMLPPLSSRRRRRRCRRRRRRCHRRLPNRNGMNTPSQCPRSTTCTRLSQSAPTPQHTTRLHTPGVAHGERERSCRESTAISFSLDKAFAFIAGRHVAVLILYIPFQSTIHLNNGTSFPWTVFDGASFGASPKSQFRRSLLGRNRFVSHPGGD